MRHRYVSVKIDSEQDIDRWDLLNAVSNSLLMLFGEYGASLSELALIDYDPKSNHGIFRCAHKALEMVKASVAAVTETNRKKAALQIVYVSGTLKALRKKSTE